MSKSIQEALEYVSRNPIPTADPIDTPVWELVARMLYDIASTPNPKARGGLTKAARAQRMLMERKVGRRRTGSQPLVRERNGISFKDLTLGGIEK